MATLRGKLEMILHRRREELVSILEFVKDKVIVTGSYADGTQTKFSDIDFYVKSLPDELADCENGIDTYVESIIDYFVEHKTNWGSVMTYSMHTDDTLIPLEFSAFFSIDEDNTFDIEIMGVTLKASKSTYTK